MTAAQADLAPAASAAQAGDSAGITGIPAVLPLAALVSHPRNPRAGLGDLAEITASIAAHGVFEPLVVLTRPAYEAAADAAGDDRRPGDDAWTHVIVMGHRRAAASRAAGLTEVPAVIRDDLAGPQAIAAMIGENIHREGLEPLAESDAMGELAREGWSQRKIAAEIGCSQGHVSKRLALLKLPGPVRDAVACGQLPTGLAVDLQQAVAGIDTDVAADVMSRAMADIDRGYHAASTVAKATRDAPRLQEAKKTRADLQARGIPVIDTSKRYQMGWKHVAGREVRPHQKAGCLAASIDYDGRPDYTCTNPAGHPDASPADTARAREQEEDKEIRKATKARDAACAAIAAGPLPPAGELSRLLGTTLLEGTGHADCMRLACKWLREAGIAPAGADHYAWHRQLTAAEDEATLARYAFAYALAADENYARGRWHKTWGLRHATHLERLRAGGYEPTAWEQDRLGEARQVAEVRGSLACPRCGCTGAPTEARCDVEFDREAGKPVYRCREYDCKRHKASPEPAPAPAPSLEEGDRNALLRDLIDAIDPATGSLPTDVDAAIAGARTDLYGCLSAHPGDDASVTGAVRALAAAAAPHEADWTPELRDALDALADAGVTCPAPAGQDPEEELRDLVIALVIATDHTTAAGSRLPDVVDDAIGEARGQLGAAWRDRRDGDHAAILDAVRALAAAAVPHEADWTPELRDALAALADAGVASLGETAGEAVT
jgi:ParB family chromosome partitioning protein